MSKCLNPTSAWICGTTICKTDSVVSPRLLFSPSAALEYFTHIAGDLILATSMMEQHETSIPCGKCAACQIQKRKEMSTRLSHEASMHESCCFLTLTYDQDHVPTTDWQDLESPDKQYDIGLGSLPELTLMPRHVQLFIKNLRRHLEYNRKKSTFDHVDHPIRYFAVGEYGSKTHRPHYHIIIFGWSPSDKRLFKMHNGKPVYLSKMVESLWSFGFSSVSDVNTAVAKYAARYVTKKFARLNSSDDFENCVIPEFILQSKKCGGIGAPWFDVYGEHACEVGLCNVRCGDRVSKCTIPKYYWSRLRKRNIKLWLDLRDERIDFVKSHIGLPSTYEDICRMVETAKHADDYYSNKETF